MAKLVPVGHGRFSTISDEDYERVMFYDWHAVFNGLKFYVMAKIERKSVYLHRFIMNAPHGMDVDHIDGNALCNARYNLRIVTRSDNLLNRRYGNKKKPSAHYNYSPDEIAHDKSKIIVIGGGIALVDPEDWDRLYPDRWHVHSRPDGYTKIVRGTGLRMVYMAREILSVSDPKILVDHINGNTFDNRKENLRVATRQENAFNARLIRSNNSSGFKGVTYFASRGKWVAQITHSYKHFTIGYYDDPEEAARAYDAKAIELYGKFARTNFVRLS